MFPSLVPKQTKINSFHCFQDLIDKSRERGRGRGRGTGQARGRGSKSSFGRGRGDNHYQTQQNQSNVSSSNNSHQPTSGKYKPDLLNVHFLFSSTI